MKNNIKNEKQKNNNLHPKPIKEEIYLSKRQFSKYIANQQLELSSIRDNIKNTEKSLDDIDKYMEKINTLSAQVSNLITNKELERLKSQQKSYRLFAALGISLAFNIFLLITVILLSGGLN